MKKFNVVQDQKLNQLAVEFANGNQDSGEEFFRIVEPMLRSYARKMYSPMELEDIVGEFMLVAVEKCYDYAERYNNGTNNVMGLIYAQCRNRLIDLNKSLGASKRSLYKDREVSLQGMVGEEADMLMSEKVSDEEKSIEEQLISLMTSSTVEEVVAEFEQLGRGRHSVIMPLIYQSFVFDWEPDLLNDEIAKVLIEETGEQPRAESIRQAKSRALKDLRKCIEQGRLLSAEGLGL